MICHYTFIVEKIKYYIICDSLYFNICEYKTIHSQAGIIRVVRIQFFLISIT
jgi:hypothetical protein